MAVPGSLRRLAVEPIEDVLRGAQRYRVIPRLQRGLDSLQRRVFQLSQCLTIGPATYAQVRAW